MKNFIFVIALLITSPTFAERIQSPNNLIKIDKTNYQQYKLIIKVVPNEYQENMLNIEIEVPLLGEKNSKYAYAGLRLQNGERTILSVRPSFYEWKERMKGSVLIDKNQINNLKIDFVYQVPEMGVVDLEEFIYSIDVSSFNNAG